MTWANEYSHSAQLALLAKQVLYQLSYVPLLTCGIAPDAYSHYAPTGDD